jgi:hypothetical protein
MYGRRFLFQKQARHCFNNNKKKNEKIVKEEHVDIT